MTRRKNSLIRTAVLSALSLLVLLGIAPTASAATVGYAWWANTAYYYAAPGEANNVTVSEEPGVYVFSDPGATLTAQYGCTVTDAHRATCASQYVNSLYVNTGDANDTISFQPALVPAGIDCGAGTDSLNTSDPNATPTNCEYINAPPPSAPGAPPAVTPPPPVTAPPPLSILQPVATMTEKGSVPLTLSCSDSAEGRCTGSLVLALPTTLKQRQVGASRRGAPNILGREKITVARGKKRTVKVSMTGKGRSMVKRSKKLKVTAKLKITQGGKTTASTQSLTIRAPRR
jgi:hypothetical protein